MKKLTKLKKEIIFLLGLSNPFVGLVLYWIFEENNDKTIQETIKLLKISSRISLIIYITILIGTLIFEFATIFVDLGIIS